MAAKEFVMGARIRLTDSFSSPVSAMTQSARQFRQTIDTGSNAVAGFGHRTAVAGGELSAFTASSRAAMLSTRGLVAGITAATASFLGMGSAIQIVMGLLTFKFMYDWLVKSNSEMEGFLTTLTVVMKDAGKAKETLSWATKFAAETPFEIPEVVEVTTKLQIYGFTAQKVLGTVGDMASVMGKPLMQAIEAVADAQTGEIERLKEFGITKDMIVKQAAKMGITPVDKGGSITDLVGFNASLFAIMEERYKGGMEMQSKTFKGMKSNLSDFIGTVGREMGKPIFEQLKIGLQSALTWTEQFRSSGGLDALAAGAGRFASAFVAVLGWLGDVFQRLLTFTGLLWPYVAPVFDFLVNTGIPTVVAGISILAGWVLKVADAFINNWGWIEPMLQGIAIAFGLIMGPAATLAAIGWAVAQATKAWAVAQGFLNAVMMVNPVYLTIAAIGAVIGAVIWLVRNWETASQTLRTVWNAIRTFAAAAFFGLIGDFATLFTSIGQFFAGILPAVAEWGANIMSTLAQGIVNGAYAVIDAVKGVFTRVREMMPFSDAKVGPFSQLTYSGCQLMATFADGVRANAGVLRDAVGGAYARAGVTVSPAGSVAGSGQGGGSFSPTINVVVNGAESKDPQDLADTIIETIYEKLAEAANIAATGDMATIV